MPWQLHVIVCTIVLLTSRGHQCLPLAPRLPLITTACPMQLMHPDAGCRPSSRKNKQKHFCERSRLMQMQGSHPSVRKEVCNYMVSRPVLLLPEKSAPMELIQSTPFIPTKREVAHLSLESRAVCPIHKRHRLLKPFGHHANHQPWLESPRQQHDR